MKPTDELWEGLIREIREYARRRYGGSRAIGVYIHLADGKSHYEPFPDETPAPRDRARVPRWNSGPAPAHLSDFRQIYWPDVSPQTFTLSETQALVVKQLWDAWQRGEPEVAQADLLRRAGSESGKLADLFKGHAAWGTLVRWRGNTGLYRLPVLEEDVPDSGEAA